MTQPVQAGPSQFRSGMIALVGRPNVGKSTLLNGILQEKIAITSPTPQTTRHRILGVRTLPQAQLVLLDTPGIHKPKYRLNHRMVQVAWESAQGADLILFLVEATAPPGIGDRFILEGIKKAQLPVILIINKMDLIKNNPFASAESILFLEQTVSINLRRHDEERGFRIESHIAG